MKVVLLQHVCVCHAYYACVVCKRARARSVRGGETERQTLVGVANELIVLLQLEVFFLYTPYNRNKGLIKGLAFVILVMRSPRDVLRVSVAEVDVQVTSDVRSDFTVSLVPLITEYFPRIIL